MKVVDNVIMVLCLLSKLIFVCLRRSVPNFLIMPFHFTYLFSVQVFHKRLGYGLLSISKWSCRRCSTRLWLMV